VSDRGDGGNAIRAFLALEIPEESRRGIASLGEAISALLPGARFVAPEAVHLTLRFLGDSPPEALEELARGLEPLAARCPPTTAPVTGLGTFPPRGAPRVLWLGLDLPPAVRELQKGAERVAVRAGFAPERRAFVPHLTLARWREPSSAPRLPPPDLPPVRLERLVLFRSDLRPSGAVHTALRAYSLGGI
jgi:2'-5' RNA ligase